MLNDAKLIRMAWRESCRSESSGGCGESILMPLAIQLMFVLEHSSPLWSNDVRCAEAGMRT